MIGTEPSPISTAWQGCSAVGAGSACLAVEADEDEAAAVGEDEAVAAGTESSLFFLVPDPAAGDRNWNPALIHNCLCWPRIVYGSPPHQDGNATQCPW